MLNEIFLLDKFIITLVVADTRSDKLVTKLLPKSWKHLVNEAWLLQRKVLRRSYQEVVVLYIYLAQLLHQTKAQKSCQCQQGHNEVPCTVRVESVVHPFPL